MRQGLLSRQPRVRTPGRFPLKPAPSRALKTFHSALVIALNTQRPIRSQDKHRHAVNTSL